MRSRQAITRLSICRITWSAIWSILAGGEAGLSQGATCTVSTTSSKRCGGCVGAAGFDAARAVVLGAAGSLTTSAALRCAGSSIRRVRIAIVWKTFAIARVWVSATLVALEGSEAISVRHRSRRSTRNVDCFVSVKIRGGCDGGETKCDTTTAQCLLHGGRDRPGSRAREQNQSSHGCPRPRVRNL